VRCDVAGAGNVFTVEVVRHRQTKETEQIGFTYETPRQSSTLQFALQIFQRLRHRVGRSSSDAQLLDDGRVRVNAQPRALRQRQATILVGQDGVVHWINRALRVVGFHRVADLRESTAVSGSRAVWQTTRHGQGDRET